MSRLERKCFIGSAAFHGLLLGAFVFGAAFLPSKPQEKFPPVITIFNAKMTDRLVASGGNPNGNPNPPPPKPIEPPKPAPTPPTVEPPKVVKAEPKRDEPKPKDEIKKDLAKQVEKDPPKKQEKKELVQKEPPKPAISTKVVKRTNDVIKLQLELAQKARQEKAEREYQEAVDRATEQRKQIAKAIGGVVGDVSKNLSRTTVAEPVGPGGAAYVNYTSFIIRQYQNAVNAAHPQSDEDVNAVIRIVVARDGTVRSSQWVRRTANSLLDKAVDRAMNSVRSLPEFPPESKDSERSFNITIAFEKRLSA
jgi:TonB family protein